MKTNLCLAVLTLVLLLGGCSQPAASPTVATAEPAATPMSLPTPQEHAAGEAAEFTYASPESQEISPEALQELVEIVSGYCQDEEGNVISFTAHTPEGDFVRPRVE